LIFYEREKDGKLDPQELSLHDRRRGLRYPPQVPRRPAGRANPDQIRIQKQKLNDANSQIAAKDARIKELEADNKRLEVAFLESEAENQFHQNYGESEWAIHPEEDFEGHWGRNRFRSEAREALEQILQQLKAEMPEVDWE